MERERVSQRTHPLAAYREPSLLDSHRASLSHSGGVPLPVRGVRLVLLLLVESDIREEKEKADTFAV